MQCQQTKTSNINLKQFAYTKKPYRILHSENESNDSELLKTLSQHHDVFHNTQLYEETNRIEPQLLYNSSSMNKNKDSMDFLSDNMITNINEEESLSKKNQENLNGMQSFTYSINMLRKSDEEKKENIEKNNVFHRNHNDESGNRQKEKYENREEEKEEKSTTTFFSTSTTSPTLFNNDSQLSVVTVDPDTSSSSPNSLLLSLNQLNNPALFSNQLIADILQISNTKSNMNNSSNDGPSQQTITDLFDPLSPTTTTTTTATMLDNGSNDTDENQSGIESRNSTSIQPLTNYDQSMSDIASSNSHEVKLDNNVDLGRFAWETFLNNDDKNETLNPFNNNSDSNFTWETLLDVEQHNDNKDDLSSFLDWIINHLNDSDDTNIQPSTPFTSIKNLESIMKDIEMSSIPFEPIPSPPLNIDHTIVDSKININHHDLFPINELDTSNIIDQRSSMILYEADKEEDDEDTNNNELKAIAENSATNILRSASNHIDQPYDQIEHLIDRILTEAIFEIYYNDQHFSELETNEIILTNNLATIISDHNLSVATNEQSADTFNQQFNNIWNSGFETLNQTMNESLFKSENQIDIDPWLTTKPSDSDTGPLTLSSKTFNDMDLFSTTNNSINKIQETEYDEARSLSDYVPSQLLTDPSNVTTAANNLMKYTLTAPVIDDSGDDSSILDDHIVGSKVIIFFCFK